MVNDGLRDLCTQQMTGFCVAGYRLDYYYNGRAASLNTPLRRHPLHTGIPHLLLLGQSVLLLLGQSVKLLLLGQSVKSTAARCDTMLRTPWELMGMRPTADSLEDTLRVSGSAAALKHRQTDPEKASRSGRTCRLAHPHANPETNLPIARQPVVWVVRCLCDNTTCTLLHSRRNTPVCEISRTIRLHKTTPQVTQNYMTVTKAPTYPT